MNVLRVPRGWGLSLLMVAAFSMLMETVAQTQKKKAATGKGFSKVVLYTGIGPVLTQYDVDVSAATLTMRDSVTLPGAATETAFHPSRKYLYAVWGNVQITPRTHGISAFSVNSDSGVLTPLGPTVNLPSGPGYVSYVTTDIPGTHVMACLTDPANLTVYRIMPDGTIGSEVKPTGRLDFANHPHQVRIDPSNKTVILVTRGDVPDVNQNRPENPGALKLFSYKDGMLANTETINPKGGFGYQARHLDFHPSGKWDFVTLEAQQKLLVYQRKTDGTLNPVPLFTKDTLEEPGNVRNGQILGTVRVDHAGKFLYVANRASGSKTVDGKLVFVGGENSIVVFAINQSTGEPTKIQSIDTHGLHARTISFDPSGKMLVAHNIRQLTVGVGEAAHLVPPNLAVFRVGSDGKLEFVRKYDVSVGNGNDWMGLTSLP
jgi:6-phosphogluconolactonase